MNNKTKAAFPHANDFFLINNGKYVFSSIQTEPGTFVFQLLDSTKRITAAVDFINIDNYIASKKEDPIPKLIKGFLDEYIPQPDSIEMITGDQFRAIYLTLIAAKYEKTESGMVDATNSWGKNTKPKNN